MIIIFYVCNLNNCIFTIADGNGERAFQAAKEGQAAKVPARLRTFLPALLAFAAGGNLQGALEVWRHLVYLKYWTLNFRPLMVYPKVLFPPNFIIKVHLPSLLFKAPSGLFPP